LPQEYKTKTTTKSIDICFSRKTNKIMFFFFLNILLDSGAIQRFNSEEFVVVSESAIPQSNNISKQVNFKALISYN